MADTSPSYYLESPTIHLGYVPLTDAAPLIVAKEYGLFTEQGLSVQLEREPGWATVRDKLVLGRELHGAHALAGLAFVTTYGIQCVARHCVTGLIINRHGNAITLSRGLWEGGLRKPSDLKSGQKGADGRKLRLGIVHPASTHHHLLRMLFGKENISLSDEVELIVLPPELMAKSLERGIIDGFCAGEPWNSAAIENGSGFCLATSQELCDLHPEKVLLVTAEFAERRHEDHLKLITAVLKGCQICNDSSQREEIAKLLSSPGYLDLPLEIVRNSLCGTFSRGFGESSPAKDLHVFYGETVNRPDSEVTDLVLSQLRGCGQISPELPQGRPKPSQIFREDLYTAALKHSPKGTALAV